LFEAEQESGLPLRLAFIGLFTVCDRDGIFRWQPRQIKLDVMPYDEHDFSRVLDALVTRGFICRYACGTDEFGAIPTFPRHQVINNREKPSIHPRIEDADKVFGVEPNETNDLTTRERRVNDASATRHGKVQVEGEGKGREGEQEGEQESARSSRRDWLALLVQLGADVKHVRDWLEVRKAKKAKMTDTALDGLKREAAKAGLTVGQAIQICAERSWQGFNASWLDKPGQQASGFLTKQERIEAANQQVLAEMNAAADAMLAGKPGSNQPVLDDQGYIIEGDFFHAT
jgi:hypothetical protein